MAHVLVEYYIGFVCKYIQTDFWILDNYMNVQTKHMNMFESLIKIIHINMNDSKNFSIVFHELYFDFFFKKKEF